MDNTRDLKYKLKICNLSDEFYMAYPRETCGEIMEKKGRAYTCLLIQTKEDYSICVPFRSDMKHNEGFRFIGTQRSKHSRSGLDYKKAVIISKDSYFSSGAAVDDDEYQSVIKNQRQIVREVNEYVDTYIKHISGERKLDEMTFLRKYRYTTLQYFHDILGIEGQSVEKDEAAEVKKETEEAETEDKQVVEEPAPEESEVSEVVNSGETPNIENVENNENEIEEELLQEMFMGEEPTLSFS